MYVAVYHAWHNSFPCAVYDLHTIIANRKILRRSHCGYDITLYKKSAVFNGFPAVPVNMRMIYKQFL